jgi:hypothetical protein
VVVVVAAMDEEGIEGEGPRGAQQALLRFVEEEKKK